MKIRCPMKRLMKEADRIEYRLKLDPIAIANALARGNSTGAEENHWKGWLYTT